MATTEKRDNDAMQEEVAGQHAQIGVAQAITPETFQRTTHPDAQWYPQAGLGLFFHWGLSSVTGQADLSWGMMKRVPVSAENNMKVHGLPAVQTGLTPNQYWAQAERFNPDKYDPNKWMAAAKRAGVQYAVLTTKHHDGFAMWPSEYGDFNTKNYMGGRDLVGEYVEACRANGIKIGFYYSPPDWYYNRFHQSFGYGDMKPALGLDHEPVELPVLSAAEQAEWDAGFRAYLRGQIEELLTRYGKIDILWFDGRCYDAISFDRIRELQPGILVNPRGHGYGDFATPECSFPKKRFSGWWELCYVFSDGAWGYLDHETYKPIGWLLSEFVKTRSWDGNFLPNVGPDPHGELPDAFYKRMEQMEEWMAHSGESVVGTTAGPWPDRSNVAVTCKDTAWYAHVDWIFDGTVEITGVDAPESVTMLRTGDALSYEYTAGVLKFAIPQALRTNRCDVVKIVWAQAQNTDV